MRWWREERVYSLVWDAEREGHEKCVDEECLLEKECKRQQWWGEVRCNISEMLLLSLIIEKRVLL